MRPAGTQSSSRPSMRVASRPRASQRRCARIGRGCRSSDLQPSLRARHACSARGASVHASVQYVVAGWGARVFDSRWNEEPFANLAVGWSGSFARLRDGTVGSLSADGIEWTRVADTLHPAPPDAVSASAPPPGTTASAWDCARPAHRRGFPRSASRYQRPRADP